MNLSITVNKRKSKKTKKGYPIIVYATQNYQDKYWRTGYYTELSDWNSQRSVPRSKHPKYYFLLDYLNALKVRLNEVGLESTKRPLSFDEAKTWIFNDDVSFQLS